jgi:hypothetical protein
MRRTDRDFRYHPEASENFSNHFLMESPAVLRIRYGFLHSVFFSVCPP